MRIALNIQYNGASFHGWQRQPDCCSVQETVENAVSKVADESISVVCAGRTDALVHALGQVVHFDTDVQRELIAWEFGVNSYLPKDISVNWARIVPNDFHARFSAVKRHYRYIIYNARTRSGVWNDLVTWISRDLDTDKMLSAAKYLLGEHDFSSFRSAQCQSKTPIRCIDSIELKRCGAFIVLDVIANGFLHHMIRNIMGTLLPIGSNEQPIGWMQFVLDACDRTKAGVTAPPNGLYFMGVYYPQVFDFPLLAPISVLPF